MGGRLRARQLFDQLLGGMGVIEAFVEATQEGLGLDRLARRQATVRELPPATMPEGRRAPLAKALLESLKLPGRHTQGRRAGPVADPPGQRGRHQACPGQLLPAHRESLHGGMILSRSSYPTTFLCSSSSRWWSGLTAADSAASLGAGEADHQAQD